MYPCMHTRKIKTVTTPSQYQFSTLKRVESQLAMTSAKFYHLAVACPFCYMLQQEQLTMEGGAHKPRKNCSRTTVVDVASCHC